MVKKAGFLPKMSQNWLIFLPKISNLPIHFYRPFGKTFLPGLPVIYRYRVRSSLAVTTFDNAMVIVLRSTYVSRAHVEHVI